KVKAGENINRRNTWSISRIKIFAQRRDRPKWDVLKLALINIILSIDRFEIRPVMTMYMKVRVFNNFNALIVVQR
ncbi:MAG: hypothetical protein KJ826_04825, partial [Proteobacteria bacterium]|nr:hypothetical protein [Pseudomonadota bacterium]